MEEQFKNIDSITNKLVQQAGTHQTSPDFVSKVMEAVTAKAAHKTTYQPLISKKGWWGIGVAALLGIVLLYLYPTSGIPMVNEFDLSKKLTFNNPFANLHFSKTFVYGVGFLGLFFLQIPFLKRYMERKDH